MERYLKMLDFFKKREKSSRLLKNYAKIANFSYIQITIQLNISHLFALSWNVKQFYLIHRPCQVLPLCSEGIRERWQWRGTPHSPELQHYCRLIEGHSFGGGVGVFHNPSWLVCRYLGSESRLCLESNFCFIKSILRQQFKQIHIQHYRTKSIYYNKLILAEQYFRSNGSDFPGNAKFTFIERIFKNILDNTLAIIKTQR